MKQKRINNNFNYNKKILFVILSIIFFIFILNFLSAYSCQVVPVSSCSSDRILMKLYNTTNSHGELASENNYNYAVCCDFGNTTSTCSSTLNSSTGQPINKILGLYNVTNAHAESPELSNYAVNVCYDGLENCRTVDNGTTHDNTEVEVVSLYNVTNSHLAKVGDYNYTILCTVNLSTLASNSYWANSNDEKISSTEQDPLTIEPGTFIRMIIENSGLAQGNTFFEIYENSSGTDKDIRTGANNITGIVDADGKASANWTVTQTDLDNAGTADVYNFYFKANNDDNLRSGILYASQGTCADINYCRDYTNQTDCNADSCNVSSASVNENNANIDCSSDEYTCGCTWDSSAGVCNPYYDIKSDPDNPNNYPYSEIGTCNYNENTAKDPNGCDDGLLAYSWTGIWSWYSENNYTGNPDTTNYTEDPINSNYYHYDPYHEFSKCINGAKIIECPAQVQLPFLGKYTIISIIILILAIYLILEMKKKKHKKGKKTKKSKKR